MITETPSVSSHRRFLVEIFQRFLDDATQSRFVILEDPADRDQYIQFKRSQGSIYAEVGSREWDAPSANRPLPDDARAALAALGFTRGGLDHNYACDDLAQSAPYLADLYLHLHQAAYGAPAPPVPTIAGDVPSVQAAAAAAARALVPAPPQAGLDRHEALRTAPVRSASPGLAVRVQRALRSNFARIGSTVADLSAVREAVESAGSWDDLPAWVREWICKAEQGPLWVTLPRRP